VGRCRKGRLISSNQPYLFGILADPKSEAPAVTSITLVTNVTTMLVQQQKGKPHQIADPSHCPGLETLDLAVCYAFRSQF
jgi:hypothetical protein